MEMEQKDCSMKVDKLIEKHAWIASEKQLFGRSGTDYDFLSLNPSKASFLCICVYAWVMNTPQTSFISL